MDATKYLKQVKRLDILIDNKRDEIDNLTSLAFKISGSDGEHVSGGGVDPDKIAVSIASIEEKRQELSQLIDYYIETRSKILKTLESMDDPVLVAILYKRYFKGDTWERIAVDMNYTYQWVNSLHKRGIDKLQDKLNS